MPGPGSYIDPNKKHLKEYKTFKSVFKSQTKRDTFSKTHGKIEDLLIVFDLIEFIFFLSLSIKILQLLVNMN